MQEHISVNCLKGHYFVHCHNYIRTLILPVPNASRSTIANVAPSLDRPLIACYIVQLHHSRHVDPPSNMFKDCICKSK